MEKLTSVLLIDDNRTSCFIHKLLLEELRVSNQIDLAEKAADALLYIQHCISSQNEDKLPQLILLNLNMVGMSGFQFLENYQQLNFQYRKRIIIAATATSFSSGEVHRLKSFGVNDYLLKPLTQNSLQDLMRRHFGWAPRSLPSTEPI